MLASYDIDVSSYDEEDVSLGERSYLEVDAKLRGGDRESHFKSSKEEEMEADNLGEELEELNVSSLQFAKDMGEGKLKLPIQERTLLLTLKDSLENVAKKDDKDFTLSKQLSIPGLDVTTDLCKKEIKETKRPHSRGVVEEKNKKAQEEDEMDEEEDVHLLEHLDKFDEFNPIDDMLRSHTPSLSFGSSTSEDVPSSMLSVQDILTSRWNKLEDLKDKRRNDLGMLSEKDEDDLLFGDNSTMFTQLIPPKANRESSIRRTLSINSGFYSTVDPRDIPLVGKKSQKDKSQGFYWGKGIGKGNLMNKKGSSVLLPSLYSTTSTSSTSSLDPIQKLLEQQGKQMEESSKSPAKKKRKVKSSRYQMPLTPLSTLYATSRDRHRVVTTNREVGWSVRSMIKGSDERRKEDI